MTAALEDCVRVIVEVSDADNPEELFARSDGDFCTDIYYFYEDVCIALGLEESLCCSETRELYLDRCDDAEDALRSDVGFTVSIAMLAASFLLRALISGYNVHFLPEAGAAILVGLATGGLLRLCNVADLAFSDSVFMRILLPPIILAATVALDKRAFRSNFAIVMCFAVLGTMLATALTGIIVYYVARISGQCALTLVEAMLFGTAISCVDPIAVLVIFKTAGMPENHPVYVALFGESVLNDAVVFLLFHLLLPFLDGTHTSAASVAGEIGLCLLGILASILLGLAIPYAATYVFTALKGRMGPLMESSVLVVAALLPYYAANAVKGSGVVAIVLAGLAVEPYVLRKVSRPARRIFRVVLEFVSVTFETFVFAYIGIFMVLQDYAFCPVLLFGAMAACVVGRATHVFPAAFILNRCNRGRNLRRAESLASLRDVSGALSSYRPVSESLASDDPPPGLPMEDVDVLGDEKLAEAEPPSITTQSAMHVSRASLSAEDHAPVAGQDPHDTPLGPGFFRMFDAARSMGVRDAFANQDLVMEEAPLYTWTDQFLMFFCSMRGAVSFALVATIPEYDVVKDEGSENKNTLVFLTTTIIIASVFLVGGVATPVIQRSIEKRPDREATDPENDFAYRNLLHSSTQAETPGQNLNEPFLMHGYERRRSGELFHGENFLESDGSDSDSEAGSRTSQRSGNLFGRFFGRGVEDRPASRGRRNERRRPEGFRWGRRPPEEAASEE